MIVVLEHPSADWDSFVVAHPKASLYHRLGWSLLARDVFGHQIRFIEARDHKGDLEGLLPIVQQKHILLGNFATSVPFFNYGGALARSSDIAVALMRRAVDVAREWGCTYVEFRDDHAQEGGWIVRKDKVSMVLELPASFEVLSRKLGAKLRSQVKRAEREDVNVKCGGRELLNAFYEVFCRNMHSLGTPAYPKRFFEAILQRFPKTCTIVCVERAEHPVAAAFLLLDGKHAEIPWASCLDSAKPLGFNMKLYWEVLSFLVAKGCTRFDFGRSTIDSGTYKFKKQWGAEPIQLYWHRWERRGAASREGNESEGRARLLASQMWRRMPMSVANILSPWVSPWLPW